MHNVQKYNILPLKLIYSVLWSVTVTNTRIAILSGGRTWKDNVLTNVGTIQLNRPLPLSSVFLQTYHSLAASSHSASNRIVGQATGDYRILEALQLWTQKRSKLNCNEIY